MEQVVVTGVGAVTGLGVGARALHDRWCAGESGISDGEGTCADFDPKDFLTVKEARRADRFTQLAIAACQEALEDAGWGTDDPPYDPRRIGCVLATGIGGISTLTQNQDTMRERGAERVSPLAIPVMMANAGAAALSMRYGLRGPSFAVSSACASGAHGLGIALRMIQTGEADAVVAGGSEACLTDLARAAFGVLEATSASGRSLPFDARRDGFVMGEGAGLLVLERADLAAARRARVLATFKGYASTSDAYHITQPRADGEGQADAMTGALAEAGLHAQDVDYVNAHGTSTPAGDLAETISIKRALGERATQIPVSSTKSAIGHLLGAAGAVEAIATILALRARVAGPTAGWSEREEGLDLDYVPEARPIEAPPGEPLVGLSNSFGFGGHNVTICLEVPDAREEVAA